MITKNIGGSNLFSYDYTNPDAGIITQYDKDKDKIDALLTQLRSNQDCIQLVLLLSQTPPNGLYIQWDGIVLSDQNKINFTNLIQTIVDLKFKFVGIVPEFWHADDFRLNTLTEHEIFGHFLFCQWIHDVLDQYNFDWCIDLCAELDQTGGCVVNAQLLWTWWTATYFPNAAPCWNATMSIVPQLDYSFVRDIFKGTDLTGIPNWPARINLHAYRNETDAILTGLFRVGMPDRNIYIGECFTLNDDGSEDSCANDIHSCIIENSHKHTFERIIQWPIKVNKIGDPEVDVLPISFRY